jgi:glucose/arabinose dehydrogenase
MAFIGPSDILVLQKQEGRVRHVINGVLQPGQVLDVAVDNASERGLLGIAIHPNFPTTPFVYLYYTESSTGSDSSGSPLANRVVRYTWDGSVLVSPTLILDLPVTPGPNHNGGVITFGPDGKLYVVIGDLNHNGQLQNFPTGDLDDTGVIFRINDDGTTPIDNPFFSQGGNLARYYAYGVRNSFGLAFDPVTGKLWDTENGPDTFDEINLVQPGFNSGWKQIMGPDSRDPQGVGDLFQFPGSHYADPKFSWFNTVAPTAIVFLNSARLGVEYQNDAFVGDFNNGNLYRFKVNATRDGFDFTSPGLADLVADSDAELQEVISGTGFGGITDLKVGPDGVLYVLSLALGKIFVVSQADRLSNISTRGSVLTGNNVMIGGFIIEGAASKTVLIRGRGPSLGGAPFNISGVLADPFLQLFSGSSVIAQNNNWQDLPACDPGFVCGGAAQITATGLDPCQPNPGQGTSPPDCTQESAILITLSSGAYSAIQSGFGGGTGVGLVEVFEVDAGSSSSRLSNISTRGFAQTGDSVMIGGFIVEGPGTRTVLIRGRGPSMGGAPFFVPGTLPNPFLRLFSGSTPIAENDNWQDPSSCNPGFTCGGATEIIATGLDPCQPNPGQTTPPPGCALESAILTTLPAGPYTVHLKGGPSDETTGVGLVEIFEANT